MNRPKPIFGRLKLLQEISDKTALLKGFQKQLPEIVEDELVRTCLMAINNFQICELLMSAHEQKLANFSQEVLQDMIKFMDDFDKAKIEQEMYLVYESVVHGYLITGLN